MNNIDEILQTEDLHVGGNIVLKGVAVVTPLSGNKIKLGSIAPGVIIAPKNSLTELEVLFPSNVTDGQLLFISFTQDVEKVVFKNAKFANKSQLGPSVKAGDSITLFYNENSDKWYKLMGTN